MKVALGTVIYSQAREYLDEYIECVNKQSDSDFLPLLINDNYSKEDLAEIQKKIPRADIVDFAGRGYTPARLRVELFFEAKKRDIELLICADADDTFVPSRVDAYKQMYMLDKNAFFYYNCLDIKKGKAVFDILPSKVMNVREISQYNFLGLSTTAVNIEKLSMEYIESLKADDCQIYDWYLFTRLLYDKGYGIYVPKATTYYRIHDDNIAGVEYDVSKEYAVKLSHYNRLAKKYPYFENLADAYLQIDVSKYQNCESNNGYWWSHIILEENYEI